MESDFILLNSASVVLSVDLKQGILIADWSEQIELDDWEITFDLLAQVAVNNQLAKALGQVQSTEYTDDLAVQLHDFHSDYH